MGKQVETSTLDLETFAHMVSHDLGAPLRGVSVHLKLLGRDLEAGEPEKAKERIVVLQDRLKRMDAMLRRIREFAHVHTLHQEGPTPVSEVIKHSWQNLDSGAHIEVEGDAMVAVGPLLAGMVVGELLSNALAHHDRDAVRIHVKIDTPGPLVTISVRDDGPGLPTDAESLFTPFSRAGTQGDEHRGAGLALARYVARHVGGDLHLVAGDGRGTKALLSLPAA